MSGSTELIPDVVVVKLADLAGPHLITPPMLAVEVRSPGTALFDLNTKKAAYERFGVRSYWIVVPDPDQPELTAFELRDGRYEVVAQVAGDTVFGTELPFAVEVVPSRLVASLPKG
jgi:Uma2 family endonuclease